MKILTVVARGYFLIQLADQLESAGCAVIRYMSLIKAIDNIREIEPGVIIISTDDYPHQWKILVQFIQGNIFSLAQPQIFLVGSYILEPQDIQMAQQLGITVYSGEHCACKDIILRHLSFLQDSQHSISFSHQSDNNSIEQDAPTIAKVLGAEVSLAGIRTEQYLLCSHPITGAFIFGIPEHISKHDIIFYSVAPTTGLHINDIISNASLERDGMILSVSCKILSIEKNTIIHLQLQ